MPERKPKVTYSRLSKQARDIIRWAYFGQISIADYVRYYFPDGEWGGDSCGCVDDRCKDGFHHDPHDECGCLPWCVEDAIKALTK